MTSTARPSPRSQRRTPCKHSPPTATHWRVGTQRYSIGAHVIINRNTLYESLFQRNARNPILRPSDWPYSINTVFNPAATRLADGTTLLLCRVEDRRGQSHLSAARSTNGLDGWQIERHAHPAP